MVNVLCEFSRVPSEDLVKRKGRPWRGGCQRGQWLSTYIVSVFSRLCLQSSWGHNFGFVCWHWNSWASGSIYGSQCHNVRQGWADLWSPIRTILSKGMHVEKINMLVENNFVLIKLIFFSLCLLQLWGSHVYIRMPLEIVFFLIETIIFWDYWK